MEISGFEIGGKRVEFSPPTRSGSVPSAIAQALVGFAPPSSSVFDSLREPEEEQQVAANDDTAKPTKFYVRTARARPFFPVFGRDRVTVQRQHEDLCPDGEQCIVLTPEEFYERSDREREAAKASRTTVNDQLAERLQFDAQARADRVAR